MIVNRAPRRRLRPIFVGLGIGLGVVGLGLGPAHSSTAAESSGAVVKADTVLSNEYGFGDNVVVRATVEATSLVNGQLSVGSAGGTTSIVRDIQVPGGSTKEFLFVVPVSTFNGLPEMQVQLRHGTDVLADKKVSFTHTADLDVTGLLPRLRSQSAQLPGRVALEPDVRRSIFVEVPAEVMDLGLGALGQLDTIAGTSADLAGLSTTGRAALIGWISAGGRLVLDDDTDLGALPESWRPQPGSYAQAGLGEVALVDGKASAGKWKEILLPSEIDQMDGGFGGGEIFMDPQMSLARRAGVSPPGLSPILIGLSLYVLVVGPVLYLVLRAMRRLTLAWLVIPALAIVTAVGVAIGGGSWRRVGHPVANLTREAYPGGSATSSETLVFSRGGGRTSIALPAGWTAAEPSIFFG